MNPIELAVGEGIATVSLNRPESRNAVNLQLCEALEATMLALAADETVRVVIVRANGPVFCAGADLKERKGMDEAAVRTRRRRAFDAYGAIERLPQPAIAAVHGAVVGSGCEIAAACDFIIAADDAGFRYPEVGWGTVGATQRLPRIVGTRMAKELLFTGRNVDAAEARAIGLANRVVPRAELDSIVLELARAIAKAPPVTLRLAKRAIDAGVETTRAGALQIELDAIEENLARADWRGSIASFGEKK